MCPRSTSSLNIPKGSHSTLMCASKTNAPLTTCRFLRSSPPLNLQRRPQQAHDLCKNYKEKETMELSCGSRLTIAWCTTRRLKTRILKWCSTFAHDSAGGVRSSYMNIKYKYDLARVRGLDVIGSDGDHHHHHHHSDNEGSETQLVQHTPISN